MKPLKANLLLEKKAKIMWKSVSTASKRVLVQSRETYFLEAYFIINIKTFTELLHNCKCCLAIFSGKIEKKGGSP